MLTLTVTYVIREGCEREAERFLRELTAATRSEPGCRAYHVHRSTESPRTYLIFEQYTNAAALNAHRGMPYFERFAKNGLITLAESRVPAMWEPL